MVLHEVVLRATSTRSRCQNNEHRRGESVSLSLSRCHRPSDSPKVTAPFLLGSLFSLLSRHFNSGPAPLRLTVTLVLSGPRGTVESVPERANSSFSVRRPSSHSLPLSVPPFFPPSLVTCRLRNTARRLFPIRRLSNSVCKPLVY